MVFLSSKNWVIPPPQHGSALDLLWGGESPQLPRTPAVFNCLTLIFLRITIEKLIHTLDEPGWFMTDPVYSIYQDRYC